jgi:hypothetical protein
MKQSKKSSISWNYVCNNMSVSVKKKKKELEKYIG